MRKFIFSILVIASLLAVTSCKNSTKVEEVTATETVDSLAVDSVAVDTITVK